MVYLIVRIVGTNIVSEYFEQNFSNSNNKAAQISYAAWETITRGVSWDIPQDIKSSHPKVSILKRSRVVFNIKGNDFRLICSINYPAKVVLILWFGSHQEYDKIDADEI